MNRRFTRWPTAAPVLRGLAVATALFLVASFASNANGQVYVQVQKQVPGTPQTGNANLTGTIVAGSVVAQTIVSGSDTLNNAVGVKVRSNNWNAIEGYSQTANGVFATSISGYGVYGFAPIGIYGQSTADSIGVYGIGNNGVCGVVNDPFGGTGVYGTSQGFPGYGVLGSAPASNSGMALFAIGNTGATGLKSFVIDHPLDPANKTLRHFCAEGVEPLNVYSGNVTTDRDGYATVKLPDWIESINRDFRYQLTVVDDGDLTDFVQVKIVRRIVQHQFTLRTSVGNVEVSWQLTGTRNDAYVRANPPVAEEDKRPDQRGKYWSPELYGASREQSIVPQVASTLPAPLPAADHDISPSGVDAHGAEHPLPQDTHETGATTEGRGLQPTRTQEIHR